MAGSPAAGRAAMGAGGVHRGDHPHLSTRAPHRAVRGRRGWLRVVGGGGHGVVPAAPGVGGAPDLAGPVRRRSGADRAHPADRHRGAAELVPTVVAYLVAAVATRDANGEPWASVLLRTVTVAGVAAGCVGLSRIQRSRVRTIGGLVRGRSDLLAELSGLEQRERRTLSEHLHDGALQYVLAARQDLDDARDSGDQAAFTRLEEALDESSRLLRSTVAELHPSVLARAGLAAAVRDLAASAAARGGLTARVDTAGWPDALRTTADGLLHRTARELLGNVVKHAGATTVTVTLACADGRARLVVADDGVGLPDRALERVLGAGHIGLASHAARVDAAGGRLVAAR